MKTVEHLLEQSGWTVDDLAERAQLEVQRVAAIAAGRWTPAPDERARIAAAFGIRVDQISWGHSMDPRNIRYRRFGFQDRAAEGSDRC
ncbi:MAG: helix-turn-helix domain-containing protein [Pirellulaceae bacterium]